MFAWTDDIHCNIVNIVTNLGKDTNHVELEDMFWFLYFDGSKTQEGLKVGHMLIDSENNKQLLSCRLEFECMKSTTEYEALV